MYIYIEFFLHFSLRGWPRDCPGPRSDKASTTGARAFDQGFAPDQAKRRMMSKTMTSMT